MKIREITALVAGVVLVGLATTLVVKLKHVLSIQDWGAVALLTLIPVIISAAVSGRLREFSAPGGLVAKFAEEAHATLDLDKQLLDLSSDDLQMIPKDSVAQVKQRLGYIRNDQPIALTLTIARGANYYTSFALLEALKAMAVLPHFRLVLILEANRVLAYVPASALRAALERADGSGNQLITAINEGHQNEIIAFPGVLTQVVTSMATNVEALRTMERLNVEAVVAVDKESHEPRGIVERERLLARMMLALAAGATKKPAT